MRKSKFKSYILNNITILNAGSEGKSIARHDEKVIMVDHAVPGDIVDLKITSSKKSFCFAKVEKIIQPSVDRVEPFCSHFGTCGGCKWQHMSYEAQLKFKQQQVTDAFQRLENFLIPNLKKLWVRHKQLFTEISLNIPLLTESGLQIFPQRMS